MTKKQIEFDINDLKCCANCLRFHFSGDLICRSSIIHADLIKPWFSCTEWEWDKADIFKRQGRKKRKWEDIK